MKNRELIDVLMDAYFKRKSEDVNVAIQREDGNYDYYDEFHFNPETGSIIVEWKEVKKNKESITAKTFPNDYCIKLVNYDEYERVHKAIFTGENEVDESAYTLALAFSTMFNNFFPMYAHIVEGKLVGYNSENQSDSYYDADDWLDLKERLESND